MKPKAHSCGVAPEAWFDGIAYIMTCDNCYDWTPDGGHGSHIATGFTKTQVIQDWNEQMEDDDVSEGT
jgi:hypothetical protein